MSFLDQLRAIAVSRPSTNFAVIYYQRSKNNYMPDVLHARSWLRGVSIQGSLLNLGCKTTTFLVVELVHGWQVHFPELCVQALGSQGTMLELYFHFNCVSWWTPALV